MSSSRTTSDSFSLTAASSIRPCLFVSSLSPSRAVRGRVRVACYLIGVSEYNEFRIRVNAGGCGSIPQPRNEQKGKYGGQQSERKAVKTFHLLISGELKPDAASGATNERHLVPPDTRGLYHRFRRSGLGKQTDRTISSQSMSLGNTK